MKTESKGMIDAVNQLYQAIEQRKAAEKVEKELKGVIKEFMGKDTMLSAGGYIVIVEDRVRTDLDRKALTIELGTEFLEKFTKTSHYDIMSVKPATRGTL
jgi:hypothetical protein